MRTIDTTAGSSDSARLQAVGQDLRSPRRGRRFVAVLHPLDAERGSNVRADPRTASAGARSPPPPRFDRGLEVRGRAGNAGHLLPDGAFPSLGNRRSGRGGVGGGDDRWSAVGGDCVGEGRGGRHGVRVQVRRRG